jgi:TonB family protein
MNAMIRAPQSVIRWDCWLLTDEADRRFRRIVAKVGTPVFVLAAALSWWKLEMQPTPPAPLPPKQYVELLPERPPPVRVAQQKEPEKPASKNAKAVPQPTPKVQPVPSPTPPLQSARQIAEQAGIMRLREQLAELRNQSVPTPAMQSLRSGRLTPASIISGAASESMASSAAKGSGGIGGGIGNVTGSQGGIGLGTRRTGAVSSGLGGGGGDGAPGRGNGEGFANGRTLEEIQLSFDRNKASFFAIFNRTAREKGLGAGRILVSLTIAPDGSVTRCELVSSSFGDRELEQKILQKVKSMNFGAKAVPPFSYPNYPINFIPS